MSGQDLLWPSLCLPCLGEILLYLWQAFDPLDPHSSSRNKLPFMILSPPEQTAEKWFFLAEKCIFPTEKCNFLPKNAVSYRKMHFPAEKCAFLQKNAVFGGWHMAGNRRKLQEGFRAQESRTLANFHKNSPLTNLSAPQRCNAERSDAQRDFSHRNSYPLFYSVIAVMLFPVFQHRP